MTAITAITAQNTVGVEAIQAVPPEMIVAQVRAVADDIGVDAVKIGMLGTVGRPSARCATRSSYVGGAPVVIDPVMVAESGAVLLDDAARQAIVDELLPLAAVITPNLPEARVLAGGRASDDAEALARALHALGPAAVVVTGGHRDEATDVFFDGERAAPIPGERHADGAAHGSGCTHSSALAAHLALGFTPLEAARRRAGSPATPSATACASIGRGAGPVDVFDLTAAARERAFGAPARSPAARRVT